MGEGGTLALANGTPYKWRWTDQRSYQMKSWSFPMEIDPGMYHCSMEQDYDDG